MGDLISFETRFDYGEKQPDEFHSELGVPPEAAFVVAYDNKGYPASRYGDDVWDLSAYQKNKARLKLNFASWIEGVSTKEHLTITAQIKWLLFLCWYFSETAYSANTLYAKLSALRNLAKFCFEYRTPPIALLSNPIVFASYLDKNKTAIGTVSAMITALINMGEAKRGFPLLLGSNLKAIGEATRIENARYKQHPVIPTRIYSALISRAIDELEVFEAVVDPFLQLIGDCASDPQLGRYKQNIKGCTAKFPESTQLPNIHELLDQYGLLTYVETYSAKAGKEIKTTSNLASHLREKQSICFLLVTLFSGMRRGEINRLPYDCIEIYHENGRKHYRLCGETFKLADGLTTRTKWVTDPIVLRAILVAQKIAELVYSTIGESLNAEKQQSSDYPLFVGMGYLPFSGKVSRMTTKAPYSSTKDLGTTRTLSQNLLLTITEEDILELESIDPFRNWRSETKFTIGSHWLYSPHQARRSLAVYAAASGLVSLQSLRRQLQHISEEMTVYYAKGSAYAKNIAADNKDHFSHDYQSAQPEAQALAYIAQILMSDEPLFGGHGAWVAQRFDRKETLSAENRNITMQRFKKGELAYKATPLGGCTTIEPCYKKSMRTVSACLECAKAVIKSSSIDKVIKKTRAQINRLDPESKEAELKEIDLSKFVIYRDRINAKAESQ